MLPCTLYSCGYIQVCCVAQVGIQVRCVAQVSLCVCTDEGAHHACCLCLGGTWQEVPVLSKAAEEGQCTGSQLAHGSGHFGGGGACREHF